MEISPERVVMPKKKLLHGNVKEFRCIGILLQECRMPAASCDQCWFGTDNGEPTLVSIAVFNRVQAGCVVGEFA